MLNEALDHHWDSLNDAGGEIVRYIRGSTSDYVPAVIGQSIFEDASGEGEVRARIKTIDFLIQRDKLKIDRTEIEPMGGDQIRTANGSIYDVLPGGQGSAWEWSEGRETNFRIHTVRRKART